MGLSALLQTGIEKAGLTLREMHVLSKGGPTLGQRLVMGAEGANNGVIIEQDF